ncbi:MAG: hypothetical protein Q8M92_01180 [Candidatus Subteraquimicrobiales bacterium]|nr:hypothetical protein [Candidatus Subteraquimicrobiales bacterium]
MKFNKPKKVKTKEDIALENLLYFVFVGVLIIFSSYFFAFIMGNPSPSSLVGLPDTKEYPLGSEEASIQHFMNNEDLYRPDLPPETPLAPPETGGNSRSADPSNLRLSNSEYSNLDDSEVGDPDDYAETDYTV